MSTQEGSWTGFTPTPPATDPRFTAIRSGAVGIELVVEDLSPAGAAHLLQAIGDAAARVGLVRFLHVGAARELPGGTLSTRPGAAATKPAKPVKPAVRKPR